ncbi:hypothetical protein BGZ99_005483 [Dissophora globulifera]|uniref:Uncharacterized protein n=1 Tax=Dissophora globulifera TaxID=979702 RepID=A0A9P6RHG3_9FUNG|nr:hypothetical protein BGZ99_005483 [Dissophora globulifera]
MEHTQSFRLIGTTQIENIPIQYVDGQSVVYWESIERAFPGVRQVKNGDVAIHHCIKSFPDVVLDVVLSSATEPLDVDPLMEPPSVNPTAALADALTVGSIDALADLPSKDNYVEGLKVANALPEMPSSDIRAHTLSPGSSTLSPISHSKVRVTSKTALSFKHVVQLASKKANEFGSEGLIQELRGDMARMIKL